MMLDAWAAAQRAGGDESQTLRETDRRNMPLLFPLSSDQSLEFENPQMWHSLTFGIGVMATGEVTGETAQTETCCNMEKHFSCHLISSSIRAIWAKSVSFQRTEPFFLEMRVSVVARVATCASDSGRTSTQVFSLSTDFCRGVGSNPIDQDKV